MVGYLEVQAAKYCADQAEATEFLTTMQAEKAQREIKYIEDMGNWI